MSTNRRLGNLVNRVLRPVGLAIKVLDKRKSANAPPPLFDDPLEALWHVRGGRSAAFKCPIEYCIRPFGQSFADFGWEPLTEMARQLVSGSCVSYAESVLFRYYDVFHPHNASEAVLGFRFEDSRLHRYPPYAILCLPWTFAGIEKVVAGAERGLNRDNNEHGEPRLTIDTHGTNYFGPVDARKGDLEFRRILSLVDSIRKQGFERRFGDVYVTILRRADDIRFLKIGGGYHRTAVMSALGQRTIPATLNEPYVISLEDAAYWPQVRRGVWSKNDAERYFNHLFDFDSREWARGHGLTVDAEVGSIYDARLGPQ